MTGTAPLLTSLAPEAVAAWSEALGRLTAEVDPGRLAVLGTVVRTTLGADPELVPGPSDATLTPDDPVTAFAEQFVVDVSAVTPERRAAALSALGADAFVTVQALYALDLGTRLTAATRALFGESVEPAVGDGDLWSDLESFMRAVARLDALDATTTEVVRLRGARAHACRLCQSIRNVHAVRAGASEDYFAAIDEYETSSLPDRHKVALRLVDAMVWTPADWPAGLAAALRAHYSDTELVELVLDVVRNAANKIAVAFGADDPHVTEGLEYYAIDEGGELVYGLTP